MGVGSAKKAAAKTQRTPVKTRQSTSRAIKAEQSIKPEISPTPSLNSMPRTSRKTKSAIDEAKYSSKLPTDEQRRGNGRVAGRSLIVWNRPRMAEKLLLHLQYECIRHKVAIPWDAIAHRFHPGSSGPAIQQHLSRVRRELIGEGHLVPPLPSRPSNGEQLDPEIRGYMRDASDEGGQGVVRGVRFDEHVDDRKFSLPGAGFVGDDVFGEEEFEEERSMRVDDSPTPLSRAFRGSSSGRRPIKANAPHAAGFDLESIYPLPADATAIGVDVTKLEESTLDSNVSMYPSPQGDRGLMGASGDAIQHVPFHAHQVAPPFNKRHENYHPAFMYGGDPFLGHGPIGHTNAEAGAMKQPLEHHRPLPYGHPHWQMPYSYPPPPFNPYMNRGIRGTDKADEPPLSHSFSTVETKIEESRAQTLSPSDPSETHMDDLLNETALNTDILETIDPLQTISV